MFKLRSKKTIIISVIVLFVVFGAMAVFAGMKNKNKIEYITTIATKVDLVQSVSEVGVVKSASEIKLGFLSPGKIAKKLVEVGDDVKKGQILGELDYQSLVIRKKEAKSNLDMAKANLDKIISGATYHDIAVLNAQVRKASQSYASSKDNLEKVKKTVTENIKQAEKTLSDLESDDRESVTPAEQAVIVAKTNINNIRTVNQNKINNQINSLIIAMDSNLSVANTALDKIDSIIDDDSLDNYLSVKNSFYLTETKSTYDSGLGLLTKANNSLALAESDKKIENIRKASIDVINCLNKVFDSLNYCYSALEASIINETALSAYKTMISGQITLVGGGVSLVETTKQSLDNVVISYNTTMSSAVESLKQASVALDNARIMARNALASIKTTGDEKISGAKANMEMSGDLLSITRRELEKMRAPARKEDIELSRAKVAQAQAAFDLMDKQIEDSVIRTPIDGKVVKSEYEVGEQALVGKTAFSVLGENNFEIEVDISESDIAKVAKGQKVSITMDAFGDDVVFLGVVSFVEPAETVISEVIYYKVTIKFTEDKERMSKVKSGMTANVVIVTKEKKKALVMPARAVIERNGVNKIIRVLRNNKEEKVSVKTGIRGDGGLIEVLSGIKEGEEIIVSVKK